MLNLIEEDYIDNARGNNVTLTNLMLDYLDDKEFNSFRSNDAFCIIVNELYQYSVSRRE